MDEGGVMEKFIPTTDQVRDAYSYDPEYEYHRPDDPGYHYRNRAAFNRWLNQVKAEVWDERHRMDPAVIGVAKNPYRTDNS